MYKVRYDHIAKHLEKHVHCEVEKGAIFGPLKEGKCTVNQIPYLNKHGTDHVFTVISKASELLENSVCKITPYEGYLLLLAIQFHDVGIIFGRTEHEKKCREIIDSLGIIAGTDRPEKRVVIQIASVHGGLASNGGRDTISQLEKKPSDLMGQSIRMRLLAAILRLADELADDSKRASVDILRLDQIPDASKIYHLYSQSLHSVMVEKTEIRLNFEIEEDTAIKQFMKDNIETFLLDEIYGRTLKVYSELLYCMRFMRPDFNIETVKVDIKIYPSRDLIDPIQITYPLEETGYPEVKYDIFEILPKLQNSTGSKIKDLILATWRN